MSNSVNQKSIEDTRIPIIVAMSSVVVYLLVHIRLELLDVSNQYTDILIPLISSLYFGFMLYSIIIILERHDLIKL